MTNATTNTTAAEIDLFALVDEPCPEYDAILAARDAEIARKARFAAALAGRDRAFRARFVTSELVASYRHKRRLEARRAARA